MILHLLHFPARYKVLASASLDAVIHRRLLTDYGAA